MDEGIAVAAVSHPAGVAVFGKEFGGGVARFHGWCPGNPNDRIARAHLCDGAFVAAKAQRGENGEEHGLHSDGGAALDAVAAAYAEVVVDGVDVALGAADACALYRVAPTDFGVVFWVAVFVFGGVDVAVTGEAVGAHIQVVEAFYGGGLADACRFAFAAAYAFVGVNLPDGTVDPGRAVRADTHRAKGNDGGSPACPFQKRSTIHVRFSCG